MRTFAIVCLAIAAVVADSDPEAYTPLQVALGQTKGGVITGVDYGHGSGLVPAVGVAAVATHHAVPVAAAHAVPVVAAHAVPVVAAHAAQAVVSSYAAPAVVSSYSALPYTGYAGHAGLGYTGYSRLAGLGYTGYTGLAGLGYNRHYLGKREADSEADAYTIGQVAHGLTQGGVVTGVDYGNGLVSGYGAIGNRPVAYTATHALSLAAHAAPIATHVVPAVATHAAPIATHVVPALATHAAPIATHAAPAVVSTYAGLPYTGYTGLAGLGYTRYSGLAGLGYNRHYLGKREADSEADAYTIGQVAHGLPYANAVAAGNAYNPGYITGTNVPVATYAHGIPTTTYAHGIAATIPTTYSTLPYATGYAGHLGYGYGIRSFGWNY